MSTNETTVYYYDGNGNAVTEEEYNALMSAYLDNDADGRTTFSWVSAKDMARDLVGTLRGSWDGFGYLGPESD